MRRFLRRGLVSLALTNRSRSRHVRRVVAGLASAALLAPLVAVVTLSSPAIAAEGEVSTAETGPICGCIGDFADPTSIRAALNDPVEPGADGLSADGAYRVERDTLAETAVVVRVADEQELFEVVIDDFTLGFGFSPDGGRFVVYGATTRMFDLEEDGREILTLDDHDVTFGFSPDGRFALARWVEDLTDIRGRLFDAKTGATIALQGAETITSLDGVGFGPGSETFWIGTPTTSHIYRTTDWSLVVDRNAGPTAAVFFSPFGDFIQMVTTQDTQVELWVLSVSDGAEQYRTVFDAVAPVPGPGGSSDRGAAQWGFSPSGQSFAVLSRVAYDAQLTIANLDTGSEIVNITGLEWSPESDVGAQFSPCGHAFALTSELSGHPQTAVYSTFDGSILGETLLNGPAEGQPFDGAAITVRATADVFEAVENDVVHEIAPNLMCAEYRLSALEELPGGLPATLTVLLDRPAPPGGFPLTLTSDSPLVVVPDTVTVPAGATTVDVEASTVVPEEDTPVALSLDLDIRHQMSTGPSTITVTVITPRLWYLSIDDWSTLQGGTTGAGDVYLHDPAPVGGVTVALTGDDDVLRLPDSVTIPEGEESAAFEFEIGTVAEDRDVTVTAQTGTSVVTLIATVIASESADVPGVVPNVRVDVNPFRYTLHWGTPDNGGSPITGYRVYVEDTWVEVAQVHLGDDPNRSEQYEVDVSAGTNLYRGNHLITYPRLSGESTFRVTAVNAAGEGPASEQAQVTWSYSTENTLPTPGIWPPPHNPYYELVDAGARIPDTTPVVLDNVIGVFGFGFTPGERVVLSLFSTPTHLGDVIANDEGEIRAMITIPADAPTGPHTIVATGMQSSVERILPVDAEENHNVTDTIDGMTFVADSSNPSAGATVTDYDPAICGTDIAIPREVTLDGVVYEVKFIGKDAFNLKGLTSVYIPNSVIAIGDSAFYRNLLTDVRIPDSVITIGDRAFWNNHRLESVTFGDALTAIGRLAFYTSALREVTIPDSVVTIGAYAFQYNNATSITIGDSVTTIGDHAFQFSGNGATALDLGSSVIHIGDSAFSSSNFPDVTVPDSVETIGTQAFYSSAVSSVTLGSSVETVGAHAFYQNRLTEVTIPDSVITIGSTAFAGSTSYNALRSITLGNSLTTVGDAAFANNFHTEVTIPASVITIGERAFSGSMLRSVYFEGDAPLITPGDVYGGSFGDGHSGAGIRTLYFCTDADGFTTPTWQGYDTEELIECDFGAATASDPSETVDLLFNGEDDANPATSVSITVDHEQIGANVAADATESVTAPAALRSEPVAHSICSAIVMHSVMFDTTGGSAVDATTVGEGDVLIAPPAPTRDGYVFTGWYTDLDATKPFDVETPITGELTLYAGWEVDVVNPVDPVDPPTITVEGPSTVVEGETATYQAIEASTLLRLFDVTASEIEFAWDTNRDGDYDDGAGASIDVTFTTPGAHMIAVKATNAAGTTTATLDVTVTAVDSPTPPDGTPPPDDTTPPSAPSDPGDATHPGASGTPSASDALATPHPAATRLPAAGAGIDGIMVLAVVMLALGLALALRRPQRTRRDL